MMSKAIKDGGPAFPIPGLYGDEDFNGMSLRDYFAAKAMQGLLAKNGSCHPKDAYEMADAMLAEREQS